jgi:hypothetical protein
LSLYELLENLTLEDIEKLRELKLKEIQQLPTFSFSKIRFSDLKRFFKIEQNINISNCFENWFNSDIEIQENISKFLENLILKNRGLIQNYNEEDLKIHFLSPLFYQIDFKSFEKKYRDFYNEKIRYENDKLVLSGEVDFVLAKGLYESETPYFFIQEFKKGVEFSDPRPQLVAELIAGLEISNFKNIKGAYIIGSIWNFVILEKIEKDSYRYYVSENFDSSKIGDLNLIYKNLLFIKKEIEELLN